METKSAIEKGLLKLGLAYTSHQVEQLSGYLLLMQKWNKVHNLTRVKEEDWVNRHLMDSLALCPYVNGENHIDVGTGAGLPGIPLSIMRPQEKWTLLDASHKRIAFLTQVKIALQLQNVTTVCSRVENFVPQNKFNNILTRAFASLADMIRATQHLCAEDGKFLAMKANLSEEERDALSSPYQITEVIELKSSLEGVARKLVVIQKI